MKHFAFLERKDVSDFYFFLNQNHNYFKRFMVHEVFTCIGHQAR